MLLGAIAVYSVFAVVRAIVNVAEGTHTNFRYFVPAVAVIFVVAALCVLAGVRLWQRGPRTPS